MEKRLQNEQPQAPTPEQQWDSWCLAHGACPVDADAHDIADFVLDLKLAGVPRPEIVLALEHAAEMTGTWRSAQFATLRLAL